MAGGGGESSSFFKRKFEESEKERASGKAKPASSACDLISLESRPSVSRNDRPSNRSEMVRYESRNAISLSQITVRITEPGRKSLLQNTLASRASCASVCYPTIESSDGMRFSQNCVNDVPRILLPPSS